MFSPKQIDTTHYYAPIIYCTFFHAVYTRIHPEGKCHYSTFLPEAYDYYPNVIKCWNYTKNEIMLFNKYMCFSAKFYAKTFKFFEQKFHLVKKICCYLWHKYISLPYTYVNWNYFCARKYCYTFLFIRRVRKILRQIRVCIARLDNGIHTLCKARSNSLHFLTTISFFIL